jgi:hypothetical protein
MPDQDLRPRIDPKTRIDQLMVCTRAIIRSEAGACAEGMIITVDDPRFALAPECFTPPSDRLDGLFMSLSDRLDG